MWDYNMWEIKEKNIIELCIYIITLALIDTTL